MIRILIVDDHAIVRRGLAQVIAESPGMQVAGEAGTGEEALLLARARDFDVVLLDIAMPGRGGLDILKDLRAGKPNAKVIVLSIYPEEQYAIRSLRDGASAYLTKASAPAELVQAIRAVAGGRRYITPSVAERLATYVEDSSRASSHESLSDREMEVLVQMASGRQAKEIAGDLGLSVKTISTYRARLLKKLGIATSAQLIRYAIEHHLAG